MSRELFDDLYDDARTALAEKAKGFGAQHIAPHATLWERMRQCPDELRHEAAQAGLLQTGFPGVLGGVGDLLDTVVVTHALVMGGTCPGAVVGLGAHHLALPPIVSMGTDAQKARFVSPVLRGQKQAALALTEPSGGSDLSQLRTRAERTSGGYRLNGQKKFISCGGQADQITLLARTSDDPRGGFSLFVVERGMPGFRVTEALETTAWRASGTAALAFEDLFVPEENRIGPEGAGLLCLMRNLHTERVLLAAQACGIAELALDCTVAHAQGRLVSGQPLSQHQATRQTLATMATDVFAAKALTFQVARQLNAGGWAGAQVSMAKNFSAVVAQRNTAAAVQLHGGIGCIEDSLPARLHRDARVLTIAGGPFEVMNETIADGLGF